MDNLNVTKYLLLTFFFIVLSFSVKGQISPVSDNNTMTTGLCSGCIATTPDEARDLSMASFALFDVTSLPAGVIGSVSRDYQFSSNLPLDDELVLSFSFTDNSILSSLGTDVANLAIFDRIKIDLMDGTTVVSSYGGDGLIGNLATVNVLDNSSATFNINIAVPASNINAIRITSGALVSLGAGVVPSNLELYNISSNLTERYYASKFTSNSGLVGDAFLGCVSCEVAQEALAETHNADPNADFAYFRWDIGLSLLGSEYQYIEYDWGTTPITGFLGDQDGIADALVLTFQESALADVGLNDLGLGLWGSGGIHLLVTYTDATTNLYDNSSGLLNADVSSSGSGRFNLTFTIPVGKTVDKLEVRRVAPTAGLFTELRLYSIHATPVASLPLTLIDFNAKNKDNTAVLNWITEQEVNMSHFEIERSPDGIDFEQIGREDCTGEDLMMTYYSTKDKGAMNGVNYYRLKIIDSDGTYVYSNLRVVTISISSNIEIYSHSNRLIFRTNEVLEQDKKLTIVRPDGRVLKTLNLREGTNYLELEMNIEWGPILVVSVESEGKQVSTKLISNLH